jgi:predicted phosphodiesterase
MTKYVLISDIHSNYPALNAVVESEGLDANYVVLGDLMGLNSYPQETLDLLKKMKPSVLLAGNHDKSIFQHDKGHVNSSALSKFERDHTLNMLSSESIDFMRSVPFMDVFQDGGNLIAAAHAMPWPEQASGYGSGNAGVRKGNVPHVASAVADDYDYVFHGHTHTQYSIDANRWSHDVHFVNPGSLGYDGVYTVVDTETGDVDHRSVEYDHDAVKEHIADVLPDDAPSVDRWY